MNPQEQYPQGFGTPAAQPMQQGMATDQANYAGAPMSAPVNNTVTQVAPADANASTAGRKVVDYLWQRIAVCAIALAGGFMIAMVVVLVIAGNFSASSAHIGAELDAANGQLNEIYEALGVEDHSAAMTTIARNEILTGADIAQIHTLMLQKYGSVTSFDSTDASQNLIMANDMYKVVSLKMTNAAASVRAFAYARMSDSKWKLAAYDSTNEKNPCKNSTDEEKEALAGIVKCPSAVVEDDEAEESAK